MLAGNSLQRKVFPVSKSTKGYPVTEGDVQIGDYSFHTYYEDGGYEIEIAYTGG